ncbi:PQQ-binding-like beta-propeller repeat protein [candidate division KSB1 bacterium]|nr:PQQ-binding-like beta-propeller repeat protein [candidate division KSB1 bacterium]NIR69150.1 PQQ-binding-like beta-propeller repeat protein [candidate division KSB1 bacterium]NIS25661.1 PQQ-binding-like beta-propeller repeat protein [candidate division KSB1 bacterium]NIT72529.1 PQQ-binding-like beta-propeller repeat protein [candidate division KSB1 bacterium]NIU26338.1 PQQ-binding-like beta-propeller repeat protein [candidate division KSB1 bacterium]
MLKRRIYRLMGIGGIALLWSIVVLQNASDAAPGPKDWPQWRGPNRDGLSNETGILKSWPEDGPRVIWRTESGDGYSGMSVVNGRLYTMYGKGDEEVMVCVNTKNGEKIWEFRLDSQYRNQFGNGPRMTPTVDGNLVYGISAQGKLYALNAKTGKEVWGHDLHDEYGGKIPTWGVATSPLVDGDRLLVDVGGKDDYGLVAFNKNNGNIIWKTETDLPGYSSPIAVTVDGVKQYLFFTGKALISVSPKDGSKYWSYTWRTSYDVNAATPIFIPPDKVFISSGYNVGAAVLQMKAAQGTVNVEEVWRSRVMRNHFSSSLLIDNHLYGFDEGTLKCINALTQEEKWAVRRIQGNRKSYGKGSLLYADGHLIVLSEKGMLVLVEATPTEYREKASAQVLHGRCWTMPTLANGKLYVRNQKEMLCLDVRSDQQGSN